MSYQTTHFQLFLQSYKYRIAVPGMARDSSHLHPTLEESSSTDICIRCQARWTYLCAMLQYFEDDMAAQEGALYSRKTHRPSALVLYIMEHVNPGLPEGFQVEWPSIVGSTPWLIARNHMSQEELDRFYSEPPPTVVSDLEVATEEVYDKECQDSARRTGSDQPIPPSRAEDTCLRTYQARRPRSPERLTCHSRKNDCTSSSWIVTGR